MKFLLFIGLKIVELAIIFGLPYGIGWLVNKIVDGTDNSYGELWGLGFLTIMGTGFLIVLSCLFWTGNWALANHLLNK